MRRKRRTSWLRAVVVEGLALVFFFWLVASRAETRPPGLNGDSRLAWPEFFEQIEWPNLLDAQASAGIGQSGHE